MTRATRPRLLHKASLTRRTKKASSFGEEAWAALPFEARATFDVDCSNHTRQLASFQYRRMSKPLLESLLHDFQGEVRSQLGPCMRVELDSECLIRSLAKLLDTG